MSLNATVFQDAIIQAGKSFKFNEFERRLSDYSIVQAFKDNAGMLLPKSTVEALRTADTRVEKVPVLDRYAATLINARSCVIAPDEVTSKMKVLVWATVGFAVGLTPSEHANNYISQVDMLDHQFQMGWKAAFSELDSNAYQFLETNKTASFPSPLYLNAAGAYQVPADKKLDFYKNLPAVMRRHDFNGRVIDIANTEAMIDPLWIAQQGAGNDVNRAYQMQNIEPYRSNRVVTGAGVDETHYVLPVGSIGLYNWIDWESRNKIAVHEGKGWDQMKDPIMGLDWGVYRDFDCDGGKFKQKWNIITDVAFVIAYSSTTDTPDVKFEIGTGLEA